MSDRMTLKCDKCEAPLVSFIKHKCEHLDSETCWCHPVLYYRDEITGIGVWIHKSDEELNQ